MIRRIDWNQKERIARRMTDAQLAHARQDCLEAARCWTDPATDLDGNGSYYADEGSVYATEMKRRSNR